jgi:hypothetical protein
MLYEEPLKDECWRQDYGYRWSSTTT